MPGFSDGGMRVIATFQRDGAHYDRATSRKGMRAPYRLGLRLKGFGQRALIEGMRLGDDGIGNALHGGDLRPGAVQLAEVHIGSPDERGVRGNGPEVPAGQFYQPWSCRFRRMSCLTTLLEDEETSDPGSALQQRCQGIQRACALLSDKEGDFQSAAERLAGVKGTVQGCSVFRRQMDIDPQVIRLQPAQEFDFTSSQGCPISRQGEADGGEMTDRLTRYKARLLIAVLRALLGWCAFYQDGEALRDVRVHIGLMWEAERQRRAIGLKGSVGPVALILHLEQVAFEGEPRPQATGQIDGQATARGKERHVVAIFEALRSDQLWQAAADLALRCVCLVSSPRTFAERVQDAETDAVVAKSGFGDPVHFVADLPTRRTGNPAVPGEGEVMSAVLYLELHFEAVRLLVKPGDAVAPGNGVPVLVPHGDIDTAHHLQGAGSHIAQIDAVQEGRH